MDNIATAVLGGSLIIIMLGMGLTLVVGDFKRILTYPRAIFIGLFNQLILLPLIGFSLAIILKLPVEIAIGIMILSACPGGPTSNLISYLAKADLALSVTLTAISSLITILTIPFWVNFSLSYFTNGTTAIQLNIPQTIIQILAIVVIPVFLGMMIRRFKPNFARIMAKPVRIASALVLALIIIGLVLKERENFMNYFEKAGLAAFLLNIVTMLIGYYSAKIFKINRAQATSISIESGIQNGTLAITIAVVLLNNTAFAIAPAVYSLLMFFTGGFLILKANRVLFRK